jgi:hypothetical protein
MSEKMEYVPPKVEKKGEQYIPEVLQAYYRKDQILTQHVEKVNDRTVRSFFVFPKYEKTNIDMGHVSGNQLHEGIMETCFSAMQHVIENGALNQEAKGLGIEVNSPHEFVYRASQISFDQMLKSGEGAVLETQFDRVEPTSKGNFVKAVFTFEGFASGEFICLVPAKNISHETN